MDNQTSTVRTGCRQCLLAHVPEAASPTRLGEGHVSVRFGDHAPKPHFLWLTLDGVYQRYCLEAMAGRNGWVINDLLGRQCLNHPYCPLQELHALEELRRGLVRIESRPLTPEDIANAIDSLRR